MALRRRKRRGFSIDVFVKSRLIWQFFDGHERHINCARRFQEEIVRSSSDSSTWRTQNLLETHVSVLPPTQCRCRTRLNR
jgi:hypothetical protein